MKGGGGSVVREAVRGAGMVREAVGGESVVREIARAGVL